MTQLKKDSSIHYCKHEQGVLFCISSIWIKYMHR